LFLFLTPLHAEYPFALNLVVQYKERTRSRTSNSFETRHEFFWAKERENMYLIISPSQIEPYPLRLEFDLDVIESVGSSLTKDDVLRAYEAIVWDMIITGKLRKD